MVLGAAGSKAPAGRWQKEDPSDEAAERYARKAGQRAGVRAPRGPAPSLPGAPGQQQQQPRPPGTAPAGSQSFRAQKAATGGQTARAPIKLTAGTGGKASVVREQAFVYESNAAVLRSQAPLPTFRPDSMERQWALLTHDELENLNFKRGQDIKSQKLQAEVETSVAKMQVKYSEVHGLNMNRNQQILMCQTHETDIEKLSEMIDDLNKRSAKNQRDIDHHKSHLRDKEANVSRLQAMRRNLEMEVGRHNTETSALTGEMNGLEAKQAGERQLRELLQTEIDKQDVELRQINGDRFKYEIAITQNSTLIVRLEEDIAEARIKLEKKSKKKKKK